MKIGPLVFLLAAFLIIAEAATFAEAAKVKNGTRARKLTRRIRKKMKAKKISKPLSESQSESNHFPIVVTPLEGIHPEAIPIHLELKDGLWEAAEGNPFTLKSQHFVPDGYYQEPHAEVGRQVISEPLHKGEDLRSFDHRPEGNQLYDDAYKIEQGRRSGVGTRGIPEFPAHPNDIHEDLTSVPGIPGIDYPVYAELPETRFRCLQHTSTPGFYADVDTRCQVWHYCQPDGRHDRFLCPNGTIFDQLTRVCNWWYNVHCEASLSMYDINFDLYRDPVKGGRTAPDLHGSSPTYNEVIAHVPEDFQVHHAVPSDHHKHINLHPEDFDLQAGANPSIYKDKTPVGVFNGEGERKLFNNARDGDFKPHAADTDHSEYIPSFVHGRSRIQGKVKRKHYKAYVPPVTEEIPTYRERKASPPPTRKYKVVKRRKLLRT